ncbi:hypothetical protein [Idiomarina sp. UBA4520]|jgi:hypothetical protein|uniref:hypothetical protein n=1 Tax=Idiomarina sp. UBA4520 TaxID=1946647 RepID=UPI000AF663E4|nr:MULTISPECIES: hypothetical protein [unclassified Idiomarina]MBF38234.1 hypothetical protein [Idiomarinaceae bacterium]|tara:strand:+ start:96510 stop:97064 length:555 start_codon:yes stop_codon:yes gene_type:complete
MQEKQLSPGFFTYAELQGMGNTVDDIVEKTVALSADDISGYDSQDNESQYWLKHRRNNMSLFVCAMQGDTMLGHFSAMRVKTDEAMAFLEGKRSETEFTVVSGQDAQTAPHYVYISAVVVKKTLRNSSVAMKLIRQGYRLLNQYLKETPQAKGIFAEAYSEEGRRLCELFGMNNISANFYRKDR